jgi:hypothetical protein
VNVPFAPRGIGRMCHHNCFGGEDQPDPRFYRAAWICRGMARDS